MQAQGTLGFGCNLLFYFCHAGYAYGTMMGEDIGLAFYINSNQARASAGLYFALRLAGKGKNTNSRLHIHNYTLVTREPGTAVVGNGEDDVNRAGAGRHDPFGGHCEPSFGLVKVLNGNGVASARI